MRNNIKEIKYSRMFSIFLGLMLIFTIFSPNISAEKMERPTAGHYHPKDILDWSLEKYPDQKNNISRVELKDRVRLEGEGINAKDSDGKVMAIMIANATTSGAPSQGSDDYKFGYAFSYWQYVDTLVYWGGSAGEGIIVLPSADFVDSAHKNGVKVVGTVFFPPEAYGGKAQWVEEFVQKDEDGNYILVDKLIEIADTLGFDGWFINQETDVDENTAKELKEMLIQYNEKTDKTMVWYDSMVRDGYVAWQGAINTNNSDYVRDNGRVVSDEAFVDFRWRHESVDRTVEVSNDIGFDPKDAFFGFDIQSGSNLSAYLYSYDRKTLTNLMDENGLPKVSLGLYVPDSVMRLVSKREGVDFWNKVYQLERDLWINDSGKLGEKSNIVWSGISNHFAEKTPITSLPFSSSFNQGAGENFYRNGKVERKGTFLNRSTQDIMPTYRWKYDNYDGNNLKPNLDVETVYYGGSSLKLEGEFVEGGSTKNILFGSDITIGNDTKASTIKKGDAKVDLILITDSGEEHVVEGIEEKGDWDKYIYDLSNLSGKNIRQFGIKVSTIDTNIDKINIGNISIGKDEKDIIIEEFNVESSEIEAGKKAKINFNIKTNIPGVDVNVYREENGESMLLGTTKNGYLYLEDVERPSDENSKITFIAKASDPNNQILEDTRTELEFDFGKLAIPEADFEYDKSFVKVGEEVTLTQKSSISASEFEWKILGSSKETSTEEKVTVTYDKPGIYSVTLIARNSSGEDIEFKNNIITVYEDGYDSENLALKENVKVSTSGNCNMSTETGKQARDDQSSTKWCDNGNDNPWLIYELENESTITNFEILHASEGGEGKEFNTRNFDIYVSNDGEEWEKVVEVKDNKGGYTKHAVLNRAKFVKLDILRGEQGGSVARIYEFRVNGFEKEIDEMIPNQDIISELREVYAKTMINEEDRKYTLPELLQEYDKIREEAKNILDSNKLEDENNLEIAKKLQEAYDNLNIEDVLVNDGNIQKPEGYVLVKYIVDENIKDGFILNGNTEYFVNPKAGVNIFDIEKPEIIVNDGFVLVKPNWILQDKENGYIVTQDSNLVLNGKKLDEKQVNVILKQEESEEIIYSEKTEDILNEKILDILSNTKYKLTDIVNDKENNVIYYNIISNENMQEEWNTIIRLLDENNEAIEELENVTFIANEENLQLNRKDLIKKYLYNETYELVEITNDLDTNTLFVDFKEYIEEEPIEDIVKLNTIIRLVNENNEEIEILENQTFEGTEDENLEKAASLVKTYADKEEYELSSQEYDKENSTLIYNIKLVTKETTRKLIVNLLDENNNVIEVLFEEEYKGLIEDVLKDIENKVLEYKSNSKYEIVNLINEDDSKTFILNLNLKEVDDNGDDNNEGDDNGIVDDNEDDNNGEVEPTDKLQLIIEDMDDEVSKLNSNLDKELIEKLGKNYKAIVKDIYFKNKESNEIVHEFEEKQTIKIDVSGLNLNKDSKLYVYAIHGVEYYSLEYSLEDNIVTFESDKFSPYIFATNTIVDKEEETEIVVEPEETVKETTTETSETDVKNPGTGDAGIMISAITLIITSGLYVLVKKNKERN